MSKNLPKEALLPIAILIASSFLLAVAMASDDGTQDAHQLPAKRTKIDEASLQRENERLKEEVAKLTKREGELTAKHERLTARLMSLQGLLAQEDSGLFQD